jgi:hypothetical protein
MIATEARGAVNEYRDNNSNFSTSVAVTIKFGSISASFMVIGSYHNYSFE